MDLNDIGLLAASTIQNSASPNELTAVLVKNSQSQIP